ncbi:DUF4394 domain-containing protein [Gemmata sp. G18]|uniref:DUF4394 domain-containing protein n=1 Tax=Gemmata palustris TaxID=2822762 RepID=A0ABS5C3A7_9BACT|nr:DUF4394 domain-containing protein [Gemmata palustris]MBP3959638.1 DUF4394 domain-containing protein [Gemmata palustris]
MLTRILSRLRRSTAPSRPTPKAFKRCLNLEALEAREVPAILYGLTGANTLLRLDSANPTVTTTVTVTGLGANQQLVGIDFRPRTGQLYGSSVVDASANNSIIFTYRINPLTGAATLVGQTAAAVPGAGDVATGYDFNPTVDRIRYVNVNDENVRLTPVNGTLAGDDTDLTVGADIIGAAYDRNTDRQNNAGDTNTLPTTLFLINRATSSLARLGDINGTPISPNGGVVTDIGALGVTLDAGANGGFDILESTLNNGLGTAFAALTVSGITGLYSIDLTTGTATLVGAIGTGTTQIASLAAAPDGVVVVGSGLGANGDVRILDSTTGAVRTTIIPFAGFQGGVRVTAGDVNRDGIPDAVVSAIAPQGHVKVFDGVTGNLVQSFFAFAGFAGTVNVATGDVNRDGYADIIVAANGVNGHVKAFSGLDGSLLGSFLAYPGFLGNVTVSAADFNNDGIDEIVTAAAINGHVKVFNVDGTAFTSATLPNFANSFFAFTPYAGDVNVAAGDVTGDGIADIVLSSGSGTRGNVRVFSGLNNTLVSSFFAYGSGVTSGAFVALADANGDGLLDIRVTPGLGQQANVTTFDSVGTSIGTTFSAFTGFQGGATIGGARF